MAVSLSLLGDAQKYDRWKALKNDIVGLERQTYLHFRKDMVMYIQELVDNEPSNLVKIMTIIYETAARECYSYPIAGMLFEDIGSSMDGRAMNENILDNVQRELQKSLDRLQTKLTHIEKLQGIDVGIVYLLCSLGRLDKMRGGNYKIIRDLVARLFREFYYYVLAASYQDISYWDDCVVGAICSLLLLVDKEENLVDRNNLILTVGIFRKLLLLGKLNCTGNLHILALLENLKRTSSRSQGSSLRFFKANYMDYCCRVQFVLSGVSEILEADRLCGNTEIREKLSSPEYGRGTPTQRAISSDSYRPSQTYQILDKSRPHCLSTVSSMSNSIDDVNRLQDSILNCTLGSAREYFEDRDKSDLKSEVLRNVGGNSIDVLKSSDYQDLDECFDVITIPEVCLGRVIGLEGAIVRKLEIESGAKIELAKDNLQDRPVTTCMTAHRVVARALGVRSTLPKEKVEQEKEKIATARELQKSRQNVIATRDVNISGSEDQVSKAKKLIDGIVNNTTTLSFPLFNFDYESSLELIGDKVRTYECLLNVAIKLEEQEDGTVMFFVTGDDKSCEDTRKVVYEELGKISSEAGHLVPLPRSFLDFIQTDEDVEKFASLIEEMSEAYVRWLKGIGGYFLFIHGYQIRTSTALSVLNKLNIKLLCKTQGKERGENGTSDYEELLGKDKDYWRSLEEFFLPGKQSSNLSHSSGSLSDESLGPASPPLRVYDRDFLIDCAYSPLCRDFPEGLQHILDGKDAGAKSIVKKQGHGRRLVDILFERPHRRSSSNI